MSFCPNHHNIHRVFYASSLKTVFLRRSKSRCSTGSDSLAHAQSPNQPSTAQLPILRCNPASIILHRPHTTQTRTDVYRYIILSISCIARRSSGD
ncbi:hypothetical protein BU25DRAFT_149633 [Macroventuria anomochaeta]|uniref:Uncharacterized protein n=1 Tax=Macroventuria anomochaeta TaxID=301207 RepID=A0ACB6SG95_9PLEO|nr:uncharacterized protein BU25DRAFT_149633 [Macroventuria anomochaeta]KAF2632339.1 hypothetical protein BU25DRAFT_149633 [Macroventuria anomochaeta]